MLVAKRTAKTQLEMFAPGKTSTEIPVGHQLVRDGLIQARLAPEVRSIEDVEAIDLRSRSAVLDAIVSSIAKTAVLSRHQDGHVDVDESKLDDEIAFLKAEIYLRSTSPSAAARPAFDRLSVRAYDGR